MNAGTRTTVVAVALAGFVAAVVVVSRSPDHAAAKSAPRVHAAAEPESTPVEPGPTPTADGDPPSAPASESADTPRSENFVMHGLRWLKGQQMPDGSWHDPATTGIALLTFFGSGETHKTGTCRETVKVGLKSLTNAQDSEGCLVPRDSPRMFRDHAIAGLALVEAYGMTGDRVFKEPAQRAVTFAMKTRTPSSGWSRPDGRLDFEATVWMSMLVKSAKLSELDVDVAVLKDAVAAIDQMTDHATGRVTSPDFLLSDEGATAMGMLVRVFAGHASSTDEMIRKGGDVLAAKPPASVDGHVADPAACYFGTIVMHNALDDAHYTPWVKALFAVLRPTQSNEETLALRGSWEPPHTDANDVERVWTTAYLLLGSECAAYVYRGVVK